MTSPYKFDHAEATRLYAEGWTLQAIADHFNVSASAIHYAVSPRRKEYLVKYNRDRNRRLYGIDQGYTERKRAHNRENMRRLKAREASI